MGDSKPTAELHLRVVGHATEWNLLVHGEPPSEDALASWMQEGMVAKLLVAEQGSNERYTLLIDFSHVISARVVSPTEGRKVHF